MNTPDNKLKLEANTLNDKELEKVSGGINAESVEKEDDTAQTRVVGNRPRPIP